MIVAKLARDRYVVNSAVLYRARMDAGLTCEEVGEACGWSRSYQSKLENGHVQTIGVFTLKKILKVFPDLEVKE